MLHLHESRSLSCVKMFIARNIIIKQLMSQHKRKPLRQLFRNSNTTGEQTAKIAKPKNKHWNSDRFSLGFSSEPP